NWPRRERHAIIERKRAASRLRTRHMQSISEAPQSFEHPPARHTRQALRYLLVPALVALTTFVLQLPFGQRIDPLIIGLLFLLPVLVSAFFLGLFGGMSASFLSFFAFNYFFIPPYHSFVVADPSDTLAFSLFLGVAAVVSDLIGQARAETTRVVQREQELSMLYDLSKSVSRQIGMEPMLQTIAAQVCQSFTDSRCEIWLRDDSGSLSLVARA